MIAEQMPDVTQEEAFFKRYLNGDWHPSFLFLAITMKVSKDQRWPKQCTWKVRSLRQVISEMGVRLQREFVLEAYAAQCPGVTKRDLVSRMLISFWSSVFGLSIKDVCQRLADEDDPLNQLRKAFGLKKPCHRQRVSELHKAIKEFKSREEMLIELRDWLVTWLQLERLTEADVEWATRHHTFDRPLLSISRPQSSGNGNGNFQLETKSLFDYLPQPKAPTCQGQKLVKHLARATLWDIEISPFDETPQIEHQQGQANVEKPQSG